MSARQFVRQMALSAFFASAVSLCRAEDYTLRAGVSDKFSSGEYGVMTVNGHLTLTDGVSKSAVKAQTMTVGGDATYGYGDVTIQGLPALTLTGPMSLAAIEGLETWDEVNYLSLTDADMTTTSFVNDAIPTAVIDVNGESMITIVDSSTTPYFSKGVHRIALHDGANLMIQQSYPDQAVVDAANASLAVTGTGNLTFSIRITSSRFLTFGEGLKLDFDGDLNLVPTWTSRTGNFRFTDGTVLGPNVRTLKSDWDYVNSSVLVEIASGVTLRVPDVDIVTSATPVKTARLTGKTDAVVLVDATDESRSFKANIARDDLLTVCVTGTYDVVISQTTNISHLALAPESCVRITTPCVIQDLTVGKGARLIADGCEVVLEQGHFPANHGSAGACQTANGGRFVVAGEGLNWIRNPDPLQTGFHFISGSNVFSRMEIDYTYWRYTFKKTASNMLNIRGVYLFDNDGDWVNNLGASCYVDPATEVGYQPIAAGKCRFYHSSATNVAVTTSAKNHQKLESLYTSFSQTGVSNNSFPVLASPILDETNPDSYLAVEFALTNGHERVTGYNLRFYNLNSYMQTWDVEASNDGVNWTLVDRRQNEVAAKNGNGGYTMDGTSYDQSTFNAHEFYTFDSIRVDGLVQANPFSLQVDGGAAVDLRAYTGGCTVNELAIDAGGAEPGVIYGASLSESGTVNIISDAAEIPETLPLRLPDVLNEENLKKWQVLINGEPSKKKLFVKDGVVTLRRRGFALIYR